MEMSAEREFRNGKWLSYQSFNFLFKDILDNTQIPGHNHLQGNGCLQCNEQEKENSGLESGSLIHHLVFYSKVF